MSDPSLKRAMGPGPDCPDVEALTAAAEGSALRRHIENCSHCQTELALLHEFETAEPHSQELADVQWIESELLRRNPVPRQVSLPRRAAAWIAAWFSPARARTLALAGVSFVVILSVGLYLRPHQVSNLPASSANPVWRSGSLRALAPAGEIVQRPSEFRWEATADAASYHLQLREVDRTVLWSFDTPATTAAIPPEVLKHITPGRAFDWFVSAHDAAGKTLATSDLQSFHIPLTTR